MAEQTSNLKEESWLQGWLAKQPLPVEFAIVAAANGALGAVVGASMETLVAAVASSVASPKHAQMLLQLYAGGPLVQALNHAVLIGADAGISCVMRRLRLVKEDVQSGVVVDSISGSLALYFLIMLMCGQHQAAIAPLFAFFSALLFALVQVGKSPKKSSQTQGEDKCYAKTRSMLSNLGLTNYEENFKRGLLTDTTLPLLTESALIDVKIPPGPRPLILDHIERRIREVKDGRTDEKKPENKTFKKLLGNSI